MGEQTNCEHLYVTSTDRLGPHCCDCKEPLVGIFTPVSRRTPYGALLYAMKHATHQPTKEAEKP